MIINPNIFCGEDGDKMYVYKAESSVPAEIFSDYTLKTVISQPLICNNGFFDEFFISEDSGFFINIFDNQGNLKLTRNNLFQNTGTEYIAPKNISFLGTSAEGFVESESTFDTQLSATIQSYTGYIGSFTSKTDLDLVTGTDGQWASVDDDVYGKITYWWNESSAAWVSRSIEQFVQPTYKIRWMDADGTILKTDYKILGGSSTPPTTPSLSDKLTFVGWIGKYTEILNDSDIVAAYLPTDDWNHYGITTSANNFSATLYVTKENTSPLSVDFGDGTSASITGTGYLSTTHTWTSAGSYDVRINGSKSYAWCEGSGAGALPIFSNKNILEYVWFQSGRNVSKSGYTASQAFTGQTQLKYVINPNDRSLDLGGFSSNNSLKIFCDFGTKNIPNSFLYSCNALQSVFFSSATTISGTGGAIRSCLSLETAYLPSLSSISNSVSLYDSRLLKSIYSPSLTGSYFFDNAFSIEKIDFPALVSTSNGSTTYSLKTVDFSSLRSCGNSFLSYSNALNTITLPELSACGTHFCYTSNIREIYLPKIVSIGNNFNYADMATEIVDIGSSCTSIGQYFLYNNLSIKTVIVRSVTPPSLGSSPFYGASSYFWIYVPATSVSSYQSATNWSTYASRIKAIP